MSIKPEIIILNKLLDKYEKSKTFTGDSKVNQSITAKIIQLFPKYADHAEYEIFSAVNDAIDIMARKNIIIAKITFGKLCESVRLNLDEIDSAYVYLGRIPKKHRNCAIEMLLDKYENRNESLRKYCLAQKNRIVINKPVQYYAGDLSEFENILIAIDEIFQVKEETFIRDFSVKIFHDSKIFDRISSKVIGLLYEYGDFAESNHLLADLNLVKNPTYVHFKGAGRIFLSGQTIDLSVLRDDIGIPSSMLQDISRIDIMGKTVMTIENLTTFHSTSAGCDRFLIYLGGFHNTVRREFIKKIYVNNPCLHYQHFGDIDAGGFYILEHLRKQTGIDFEPYQMDVATLQQFAKYSKPLTNNDRERLLRVIAGPEGVKYKETIEYMLVNNCKLEQEAVKDKILSPCTCI